MSVGTLAQSMDRISHPLFCISKSFPALHSPYAATKQNTIVGIKLQKLPVNPLSFSVRFDIDIHNLISYITKLHRAMNNSSFMDPRDLYYIKSPLYHLVSFLP